MTTYLNESSGYPLYSDNEVYYSDNEDFDSEGCLICRDETHTAPTYSDETMATTTYYDEVHS